MNNSNKGTVQDYLVGLVHHMTTLDDGPEFEQLQEYFNDTCEMLDFLHHCYHLPSHDTNRSS